jgi:hypothetical protein
VWKKFDDIDFDSLPDRFVLKATHGSAWNIIVANKAHFDTAAAKQAFDYWLGLNYAYYGLELPYRDIEPQILAEEYLEDEYGRLVDYKFYCFEGKVHYIQCISDRYKEGGLNCAMYDLSWNPAGWTPKALHKQCNIEKKPDNLDEMIRLSGILCRNFHYVRVDLYSVKSKIYFGELTFMPMSGLVKFDPPVWNRRLGNLLSLPCDEYYI